MAGDRQVGEALPASRDAAADPEQLPALSASAACALRSGPMRPSFRRVSFQSLRAALIGSMPAAFHHARSSPARCTAGDGCGRAGPRTRRWPCGRAPAAACGAGDAGPTACGRRSGRAAAPRTAGGPGCGSGGGRRSRARSCRCRSLAWVGGLGAVGGGRCGLRWRRPLRRRGRRVDARQSVTASSLACATAPATGAPLAAVQRHPPRAWHRLR